MLFDPLVARQDAVATDAGGIVLAHEIPPEKRRGRPDFPFVVALAAVGQPNASLGVPELSVAQQPSLTRMFREHLDMQIEDIRVLLRLPTSRLPAGCNFTAAAMICNLIAGASVCFYNASHRTMANQPPAGAHFRGILTAYFPWTSEPVPSAEAARVFWKHSRNPLAHAFGLDRETAPEIEVAKSRVGPQRIAALEDDAVRPSWCSPALTKTPDGYVLAVAGLYWGTHRMLHAVLGDATQLAGAEQLASSLGF